MWGGELRPEVLGVGVLGPAEALGTDDGDV